MHTLLGLKALLSVAVLALAGVTASVSISDPAPNPDAGPASVDPGAVGELTAPPPSLSPSLAPSPRVERIAGANRYVQSVLAAQAGFVRADTVYLANGEGFADALSAAAVAGVHRAPLLLTPAAALPGVVAAELQRLSPGVVVVVGGTLGVSDAVMDEVALVARGSTVVRVGGPDRYAVSRALVSDETVGVPRASRVFVATGASYPDALTASPVATRLRAPVLLVNGSAPAPAAADLAVISASGASGVTVLGGLTAVGPGIEAGLRARWPVHRIGGADRFEVGAAANRDAFPSAGTVYLASGFAFADALSGATLAARDDAPLYVVASDCIPGPVVAELTRLRPSRVVLLGGTAVLDPALESLVPC